MEGQSVLRTTHAVGGRLPRDLPLRRPDGCAAGVPAVGLPRPRQLLRRRPLPLRAVRHDRVRHVRRIQLLVAEDDRHHARPASGEGALLDAVRRLPHHLPDPALAGRRGHAPPLRRLPRRRRVHRPQHGLLHRRFPPRPVDPALPLQRLEDRAEGREDRSRRPLGYGRSLEWATSCPPPRHNFVTLPRIRSESPAFDLRHPALAGVDQAENTGKRDVIDPGGHKGDR